MVLRFKLEAAVVLGACGASGGACACCASGCCGAVPRAAAGAWGEA